jgi:hypothetical protein
MEAFLSHSRKDKDIANHVYRICTKAKIKPHIAEFEDIENGDLSTEDIRDMIDRSDLFFLFLTENVINDKNPKKTRYTQNWVNFELGCAYAQKKEKMKSIFVCEPFQQLHFPLPYLDYYFLFDPTDNSHWRYLENLIIQDATFDREITQNRKPLDWIAIKVISLQQRFKGHPILKPIDRYGHKIFHRNRKCGAEYYLLSEPEKWLCPKCRKPVNWMPS